MRIDRVKLIALMAKKDIRVKELARLSGISGNAIASIRGGRACKDSTAEAIAKALNVTVEELKEEAKE